jgi:hypothetical protein
VLCGFAFGKEEIDDGRRRRNECNKVKEGYVFMEMYYI